MGKIVILLSDKRSGSTMVQEELCKHPDIQHVEYSPHTYFETHHWLKSAVLLGMPAETFSGGQTYPGYGSKHNARAYIADCISGNIAGYQTPEDDSELVFQGWESLCDKYASPVFFEKSPQYLANWSALSLLLDWINNTTKEVKIIGLVRNPMAVQYSAQKLFHTAPESRQHGWLELHRNLLAFKAFLSEDSYLQLKYEDLIAEPANEFANILSFIGVSENHEVGKSVHSLSASRWYDDPEFDLELDSPVRQMANHLGYQDEELYNPPKPGVSQSRKLARSTLGSIRLALSRLQDRVIKPLLLKNTRSGR